MDSTTTLSPTDRRRMQASLKRHITERLHVAGFFRSTETEDGFGYTDENGEHGFVPRDKNNPSRVGVNLVFHSRTIWRAGFYNDARTFEQAVQYEMAAALVRAGFKLTVEQNHSGDSGHIVLWADENGAKP